MQQLLQGARAGQTVRLDGALNEPAWQQAPVFDGFVQVFPNEGAAPSERTELRVLYDNTNVYVGVSCYDSQPDRIVRPLGRRDQLPTSDSLKVIIDSAHDHRNAYSFGVNAGGVLSDALIYADNQTTLEWDAVWEAAVVSRPDGWSAELAIPLSVLHFPRAEIQTWGFAVQRYLARTHEDISSVLIPRGANALVSRLGHLTGLASLAPRRHVEVTPYLAARASARPQFSDPSVPEPRLLGPSFDVGLDLKAALTSNLTLNATVNPDFGQVEADQVVLNLSTVELFLQEKRPFFLEGMDLFQSVGAVNGVAPQMLFYSRRIGLTTPILAATKLTGSVLPNVDVGILDAVVAGPSAPARDESDPDRGLAIHPSRPLHLGPAYELPPTPQVPQNFLAAVVRGRMENGSTVGGRVTTATPLTRSCMAEHMVLDPEQRPTACSAFGGNAGAIDWNLRTADAQWGVLGQVGASQTVGGPPSRILRDGTVLERGDAGLGGYLQAGKLGGEPLRFDLSYRYASPTFELNQIGFLRTQNEQALATSVGFVRPNGFGPLLSFDSKLVASGQWTADARISRVRELYLSFNMLLPGFHSLGFQLGFQDAGFDVREIPQAGIPFQRPIERYIQLYLGTDAAQILSVDGGANLGYRFFATPGAPAPGLDGWADFTVTFRPQERLETKLTLSTEHTPHGPRFLETVGPGRYLFGDLSASFLSTTFRQQFVLMPRLTLQAYAQLFTDFGLYSSFYEGISVDREAIPFRALAPVSLGDSPDFRSSTLNLTLVLRWEYRLGSTLYLVYTRSQSEPPPSVGEPIQATLLPVNLFNGPASDVLLVKWSYWWNP